ncbi:GTP cyclohydrolase 1 type 2 [Spirochaetia bacterium]|nr:GTP cyclohydrolase 1 type 2 [Spirochaetia bacterium]
MTSAELDLFFRERLDIAGFSEIDSSMNGIQVDNTPETEIKKIAFAVDACLESFKRAAAAGANMLFVHHGLFWGKPESIAGYVRRRIEFLLKNNIALYAVHLPLDQSPELGNNASLAQILGLQNIKPFGTYHGRKIGFKGDFETPVTIDEAVKRITFMGRPPAAVHAFGGRQIKTCGIISGGAAMEAQQAIEEKLDLYVTGEAAHSIYHIAEEAKLNIISGGHYNTEVWGVKRVMECCKENFKNDLEVEFIDIPTGL